MVFDEMIAGAITLGPPRLANAAYVDFILIGAFPPV